VLRAALRSARLQVDLKLLQKGNLILASAEHWDRLSRKWRRHKAVSDVSLFLVDELHLLGAEGGPTLEVVVSRMRAIAKLLEKPIRVVALAASMADGKEVGDWLGAPSHAQFTFPPSVRPVPLEIHIQSLDIPSFEARMQAMSRPTYNALLHYARAKPAIVFAPTRRHAAAIATDLMTYASGDGTPERFRKVPLDVLEPFAAKLADPAARSCVQVGVGLLHETMTAGDKSTINQLYKQNAIQVLCATAGMCRSIAAPASLVVVMGTQFFDSSGLGGEDFPVPELLQMLGLASPPGKDDAGVAVLMCHAAKKEYYKKFLFEPLPVESHLDMNLHDHMVRIESCRRFAPVSELHALCHMRAACAPAPLLSRLSLRTLASARATHSHQAGGRAGGGDRDWHHHDEAGGGGLAHVHILLPPPAAKP
jgi:pre-mRNA-splicing helicase BRR2